jgi:hypothetical protein
VNTTPQGKSPNDDLLVSWKDIAAYLKCSVRKAQRLEQRELPVKRIAGTKSVWASKAEIDRWLAFQAEKSKGLQTQFAGPALTLGHSGENTRTAGIANIRMFIGKRWWLLGIPLGFAIGAAMASAYGLTIVFFGMTGGLVMLAYQSLPDKAYMRAMVGLFIIAAMSYCASATNLPDVVDSVVNMTSLKPALAYPFVAGLRFIPAPLLIVIMLVVFDVRDDRGFAQYARLRRAYLVLGPLFFLLTPIAVLITSGGYRVWQAGLPIRWTLLAGESFVLGVNISLFVLGYRSMNAASRKRYRTFLSWYGIGYLVIALCAAILNRHWNEIDKYYLDILHPQAYRVQSPKPFDEFHNWLAQHAAEAGTDLLGLSNDQEFFEALQSRNFYKQKFDESLQGPRRAVIFGYKPDDNLRHRHQQMFLRIRFPASLAAALRFEPVKH